MILIPEIPYTIAGIAEKIEAVRAQGRNFALVVVADALFRDRAIVGRYGGDEFVVALPGADMARAEQYKADVVATLKASEIVDEGSGQRIPVMASIGIAVHPDDAKAVSSLIAKADDEMYAQKRQRPVIRPRREAA